MLAITNDGDIVKLPGPLVGRAVIAFMTEPDDSIETITDFIKNNILIRVEPTKTAEQMIEAVGLLHKYLKHNDQESDNENFPTAEELESRKKAYFELEENRKEEAVKSLRRIADGIDKILFKLYA